MSFLRNVTSRGAWMTALGVAALVAIIVLVTFRPRITVTRSLATFSDPWFDASTFAFHRDIEGLRGILERHPHVASERSAGPGGSFGIEVTLLHAAVNGDCVECVELLLKFGADVNATSRDVAGGMEHHQLAGPPLHEALRIGHWEMVAALIKHGAHLDTVDESGTTAREILMLSLAWRDELLALEAEYKLRSGANTEAPPQRPDSDRSPPDESPGLPIR